MNIYIINGMPQSGKTTFEHLIKKELDGHCAILSTVTFIKSMLAEYCDWMGEKDLKTRKLISDIKDLLTQYNDIPLHKIQEAIESYKIYCELENINPVIFIDCREPEEIDKFKKQLNAKTILIRRPAVENNETSNHADANVFKYNYDIIINNNKDLENLKKAVKAFIIKENLKGE